VKEPLTTVAVTLFSEDDSTAMTASTDAFAEAMPGTLAYVSVKVVPSISASAAEMSVSMYGHVHRCAKQTGEFVVCGCPPS